MGEYAYLHLAEFNADFPDDAACLEWLKNYLYPDGIFCQTCQRVTKHHRVASRPSYSCDYCGRHVHPTVGTIFERSSTPLKVWFHAIYLIASSPSHVTVRQLQQETGVTYKTAWRMYHQIRRLLDGADPEDGLSNENGKKNGNISKVDRGIVSFRRRAARARAALEKSKQNGNGNGSTNGTVNGAMPEPANGRPLIQRVWSLVSRSR